MTDQLPRLRWTDQPGQLWAALGVPQTTSTRCEDIANREIDTNGTLRSILDAWQAEMPYMTFEEWTGAVYALGVLDGAESGQQVFDG